MRALLAKLLRSEGGNVAVTFGLAAIPIIGLTGVALDYTRASRYQTQLQGYVDAAALAGASKVKSSDIRHTVDDYMQANLPAEWAANHLHYSTHVTSDTVIVTGDAKVPSTLGAIFVRRTPISATASAFHGEPVRVVDLKVTEFNADAWDANSIYWYIVPKDGSAPAASDLHLLLTNDPHKAAPEVPDSVEIGVDQEIGFALVNVTGGVRSYGNNSYGQPPGSVHTFYSHQEPENLRGSGFPDCASGKVEHSWDDNGGGTDDNDYNDAVYEFSCSTVRTDPKSVVLIR